MASSRMSSIGSERLSIPLGVRNAVGDVVAAASLLVRVDPEGGDAEVEGQILGGRARKERTQKNFSKQQQH